MTREISDIVRAFRLAHSEGRAAALATVVQVEGSSYRMPGARMLVEDNGKITGAISGGCLEGDALRKALQAIHHGQNKLVTYNTLHEDDLEFGVQLGCNGIVHILFEPIHSNTPNNPIELLEKLHAKRDDAVLVTLFSLNNRAALQPGTSLFMSSMGKMTTNADEAFSAIIKADARDALARKTSAFKHYADQGLTAFIELMQPPVSLVITGAGNDAIPLADMATRLGWQVSLVDGRASHATANRFPRAQKIIVGKPAEVFARLQPDQRTVFVLMTHNYNYDLEMLNLALQTESRYIATLGPRLRLERMLSDLEDRGIPVNQDQINMIYGPAGLDIGAEAPEEIALSILAEIKAVLAGHDGGPLRERPTAIHPRAVEITDHPQDL